MWVFKESRGRRGMKDYQGAISRIVDEYIPIHYEGTPTNQQTEDALLLQELVNEKLEQESRKDKLVVGSKWECIAENRGRNTVFKKGIQIYIREVVENFITFGYGTVNGYVVDSVPIDQFLLCFKPLKEGE